MILSGMKAFLQVQGTPAAVHALLQLVWQQTRLMTPQIPKTLIYKKETIINGYHI